MPEEHFRSPGRGVTDSCELPCSLNVFLLEHFLLEIECMYSFLFMAGREANGRGEEVRGKKGKRGRRVLEGGIERKEGRKENWRGKERNNKEKRISST